MIRNFSKFMSKLMVREPVQMPRCIPFRNFGSKNVDPSFDKTTQIDKQHKIDQDSQLYDKEGYFQNKPDSKVTEDLGEMRSANSQNDSDSLHQRSSKFFQPGQRAQDSTNRNQYPTKNQGRSSQKYENPTEPVKDLGTNGRDKLKSKEQPTSHDQDPVKQSQADDVHELNSHKYSRADASTTKNTNSKDF